MRILLVEDDPVVAKAMELTLRSTGAVVERVDNGREAIDLAKFYDFDVIVLDIQMPGMDGYEAVRRMRAERIFVPVLIASGITQPQFKVRALSEGADDFITKPVDNSELVARVRALVRRSKGLSQSQVSVGPLLINLETKEVFNNTIPVRLTCKEYSILELLVLRRGMIITKELFLNHLYGGMDEPEIKIIDVFICKLRKKLLMNNTYLLIETIWGRGYMIKNTLNVDIPTSDCNLPNKENLLHKIRNSDEIQYRTNNNTPLRSTA